MGFSENRVPIHPMDYHHFRLISGCLGGYAPFSKTPRMLVYVSKPIIPTVNHSQNYQSYGLCIKHVIASLT